MDMKKILIPALAAILLLVSACSQKAEYTHAIPDNVTGIAAIDFAALAEKAGLQDQANEAYLQQFTEALKTEMSAAAFQQVEAILKDPSASGIDIKSPFYFFSSQSLRQGALVAKVTDEESVRSLIETFRTEGASIETSEAEGCSVAQINREIMLAYNASTLFVVNCERLAKPVLGSLQDSLSQWMQQPEEQSYAAKAEFKQMLEQKGDIKAVYSYTSLPANYMAVTGYRMPQGIDLKVLKDLRIIAGLSFEKGSIDLRITPYTENETLKARFEQQAKATLPIRNTFIDNFPQSTLMLLSGGIDGNALYNLLLESTAMGEELSANDAAYLKRLFGMFQDDFTVGLVNVTLSNLPSVLAYATVNDAAPLKELKDNATLKKQLGRRTDIVQLEEDQYVLRSRNFNLFFGVRDKQFYATNDETLYKDLFKKCDPSASETAYAAGMKGKKGAFVINVEAVCQLPAFKMLAGLGGAKYAALLNAMEQISYLKSESDGTNGFASLQLKDRDTNALQQIVELAKDAL